jgi:hypothetical protein
LNLKYFGLAEAIYYKNMSFAGFDCGYEPKIDQIFLFHLPIPKKAASCKLHISD